MAEVIYEIQKNNNEIIRIDVSEFKGRELINVRIWYQAQDFNSGEMIYKPTQKGITLDISKFDDLKTGVEKLENYLKDRQSGQTPEQPSVAGAAKEEDETEKENKTEKNKETDEKQE
ncbi:transcriptional coactivator p15/PC4 family protein [Spirochaetota bacterium]